MTDTTVALRGSTRCRWTPALEGLPLGTGTARVHEAIRARIPSLADDRYMTPDLEKAIRLVQDNTISRAVRAAIDQTRPPIGRIGSSLGTDEAMQEHAAGVWQTP